MAHVLHKFGRKSEVRRKAVAHSFLAGDEALIRITQTGGRRDQRFEHRNKIEGRAADDLEHVGGSRLLLQRFSQLIQKARVLDRDDSLTRKALNQLYLLFDEGANLLPVNADDADQFAFSEHRHGDEGANPREVSKSADIWITFQIWRDRPQILGVHCLLGLDDAAETRAWIGTD